MYEGRQMTTATPKEPHGTYRKPTLRRLGVWNVFTRQSGSARLSDPEVGGFWDIGFGSGSAFGDD